MAKAKKDGNKGGGGRKGGNGGAGPGQAAAMIAKSEAGRERKRNLRKQRQAAKPVAQSVTHSADKKVFADLPLMGIGVLGTYKFPSGHVVEMKLSPTVGRVILEVVEAPAGVAPEASERSYLWAESTAWEVYNRAQSIPEKLYAWQQALRELVRAEFPNGITFANKKEQKKELPEIPAPVAPPERKADVFHNEETVVSAAMFLGRQGYYFLEVEGKRVHFKVARVAGQVCVEMTHADEGFPKDNIFGKILDLHGEIHVPLERLRSKELYDANQLEDKKVARRALVMALRELGESFGLREKVKTPDDTNGATEISA